MFILLGAGFIAGLAWLKVRPDRVAFAGLRGAAGLAVALLTLLKIVPPAEQATKEQRPSISTRAVKRRTLNPEEELARRERRAREMERYVQGLDSNKLEKLQSKLVQLKEHMEYVDENQQPNDNLSSVKSALSKRIVQSGAKISVRQLQDVLEDRKGNEENCKNSSAVNESDNLSSPVSEDSMALVR